MASKLRSKHAKKSKGQRDTWYLVSSGNVPAPSENVFPRLEFVRHHDIVLPHDRRLRGDLAHRSPRAPFGERSLRQVCLLVLLPSANFLKGSHHGEVGGELEDVSGEALLGDASSSLSRHLTQPVRVPSPVT